MTVHNEAKLGSIATTVLMPGDPLRAKMIAEKYLDDYKLVNDIRNMYAYTGLYKGKKVTVMASGMGIPSVGIYSYELYKFYDVKNIIRIGSAGSIDKNLNLYDLLLVSDSYSKSTYAKEMGGYELDHIQSSDYLNVLIINKAKELGYKLNIGKVNSKDTFYGDNKVDELLKKDCRACEMESFGLFYNAHNLGKNAACILTISDNILTKEETTPEERQNSFDEMVKLALETCLDLE